MTIGAAARAAGVPAWRLRAWEDAGLLAPLRTSAGYRLYSEADIARATRLALDVDGSDRLRGLAIAHEVATGGDPAGAPAVFPSATRSSEQFDLLREIAHMLGSAEDTGTGVRTAVARIAQYVEADAWSLTLANFVRQEVEVYAAFGLSEQFTRELASWPVRQGFGGQVFALREPISLPDLAAVARAGRETILTEGLRAYVGLPLTQGTERLGILELYRRSADAFARREIALLETTASLITPHIQAERLGRSVGTLQEERSRHFRTLVSQFAAAGRRQRETLAAELREIAATARSPEEGEAVADRLLRLARASEQGNLDDVDFVGLIETGILDRVRREHGLVTTLDVRNWSAPISTAFASRLYLLVLRLAEEVALTATGGFLVHLDSTADALVVSIDYGTEASRVHDPYSPSVEVLSLIDEARGALSASHGPASSTVRLTVLRDSAQQDAAGLTGRERETLAALHRGLTNREIAAQLGTSVKTIQNHLTALYRKLGVSNRGDAIALDVSLELEANERGGSVRS